MMESYNLLAAVSMLLLCSSGGNVKLPKYVCVCVWEGEGPARASVIPSTSPGNRHSPLAQVLGTNALEQQEKTK